MPAYLWARRPYWLTGLIALAVLTLYVFFISAGTWTSWPAMTNYYAQ
jgi:hypothetical protein